MNKLILTDYIAPAVAQLTLVEGKSSNGLVRLRGKLQEVEQRNGNGRVYPREVLLREVEKYKKGPISSRTSLGELDHPQDSIINLKNVSHLVTEIWWEGNDLMGELELQNTPSGNIAKNLILSNIPLGISSRGMGSVKQIGESVEVQDDFELLCWDLVSTPSTPNAYMKINESLENNRISKYNKVNSIITDIICGQGFCSCGLK